MKLNEMLLGVSVVALAVAGGALPTPALAQSEQNQADDNDDEEIDTIVVTGRRAALQNADERKRAAPVIIDSVVADEAGKLPDNSITEVLQRVQGVTIVRFSALNDPDHFSVEGSGIQVRGLSGVASRLNGREIFSANAGRSLLWGDVTPELMAAVDVYKSSSADQIEGGTGGSVDLRTKLPFDYDYGLHFAGSGEYSRGDRAKEHDYSASGLVAGKWQTGIGDFGLLVDGAYSQFTSHSDFFRMEPYFRTNIDGADYFIPGGYDFGDEAFQRKRDGIYGAVQWAPTEDLAFTGIFFQSRYRNASEAFGAFVTSQTLAVDPSTSTFDEIGGLISTDSIFQRDTGSFTPNGNPINSGGNGGASRSKSKTQDYSFAFDWAPSGSRFAVRGAYQHILSTSVVNRMDIFRDFAFPTSFGLDLSGEFPHVTLDESFLPNFDDPANYFWSASMPHNENNRGTLDAVNIDIEYEIGDGFFRSAQVGGRWSDRSERDFNNGFNWVALGRGWNGDPQMTFANAAPGDIERHVFDNFFRGEAPLPGNMLYPSIDLNERVLADPSYRDVLHASPGDFCGQLDWGGGNPDYFNCSPRGPVAMTGYGGAGYRMPGFVLPDDQTDYSTKTWAGYAMVNFGTDLGGSELTGNAGLRVVHLNNSSSGYFQQSMTTFIRDGVLYTLANRADIRTDGADFTKILPAINFTLSPSDDVKLRLAYNITMDNASFQALRANGSLGVETTPNPNQQPAPAPQLPPIFTNYTTNSGNPALRPAMSNNVDLSAEWYPRPGTTLHIAAFYKHIKDLPIYSATQQPVTVFFDDGTSEEAFASATDVRNAEEAATVKGVEIGGRVFFDELPGWLAGIGFEANYTFIDSKNPGDLYRDIDGIEHNDATLQGLSRHNYNATLLYEHQPFSFRAAYSWRSKYLQSTNSNGTNPTYTFYSAPGIGVSTPIALPVFGDAYGTLDAGITYRFNDHVSMTVQGTNLLTATQRTLMGGYPDDTLYIRSWFQSDRRISAGVNVSF